MNKPTLSAFPAALFLAGLGLTMHYGYVLWKLPVYDETAVDQSVELNLAMDLRRLPPGRLTVAELDRRRAALREEIRSEIRRERREAMQATVGGLGALALALGQFVWLRRQARGRKV